jgi:hypothetical protein
MHGYQDVRDLLHINDTKQIEPAPQIQNDDFEWYLNDYATMGSR